jgi:AcrR family transcriptional regulator
MTDICEARSDATRARLLDAAIAAFAEKGFNGTTTRDIAAAAGLNPAAVYVHHHCDEGEWSPGDIAAAYADMALRNVGARGASWRSPVSRCSTTRSTWPKTI